MAHSIRTPWRSASLVEPASGSIGIILDQVRDGMMNGLARRGRGGPDFDGADPARLGQRNIGQRPPPDVLAFGGHGVGSRFDDQIGLRADFLGRLPLVRLGPLLGRRHVLRIALRRAGIHPAGDGVDLVVRQRHIVLELVNAHRHIDMPRRHLARDHALADGFRPGPGFFIGHQRHRRHGSGAMALLAFFLQDGRDVLGERHGPVAA